MAEPTAVVFDLDDTLYPERRFALSGYAALAGQVAAETGMPAATLYRWLVRRFRAAGREGLLQAFCVAHALPLTDVPRLVEVIRAHRPRVRVPAASAAMLADLRRRGHRLGILTNGLPSIQRGKIAALAIARAVDAVVYAQECAPDGKPASVCFTTVLRRLDVRPEAAIFVGDHLEKDIAGAAAAGLRTIWMPGRQPRAQRGVADAIASGPADIPHLVAELLEERHVARR